MALLDFRHSLTASEMKVAAKIVNLGLGAFWTFRRDQTKIIALRRGAEQHKLRVVEFDGHV